MLVVPEFTTVFLHKKFSLVASASFLMVAP
jgi:hypothetical protein